jgi:ABC-type uncharacterized transport system substrate-binding protein
MRFHRLKRREFIALLGSAATAWPLGARAQQPAMPVIGFLGDIAPDRYAAFRQGLGETGYVEGRNVAIEFRSSEGHYDRWPALAAELVRRQVTVIGAEGTPAALAAKAATTTLPIVFFVGVDPVEFGLVARLNQPGGNVTGITSLNVEVEPKRLEMLHEVVPSATSIALLVNPTSLTLAESQSKNLQAAARALGLQLHVLHASTDREIETVFATLVQQRVGALVIGGDVFFNNRTEQLAALSVRHAMPTIFQYRRFTAAGGLMSYGPSFTDSYRLAGVYIGRILKGEKPADLPVQQLTKIELFINLKAAKALGITVPLPLSGRADEVFE